MKFIAEPAPELDRWFDAGPDWGGGDGVFSIPLDRAGQRVLITFGDTFTDRQRRTMVNNSIAILELKERLPQKITFFFGEDEQGSRRSFVAPADGRGHFWLGPGVRVEGTLYLFAAHIELTSEGGPFGFRQIGTVLLTVTNPDDPPPRWKIEQTPLPFFHQDQKGATVLGSATLIPAEPDDPFVYVYGFDEEKTPLFPLKHAIIARVEGKHFGDFSRWEFYTGPARMPASQSMGLMTKQPEHWVKDFRRATRLASELASEYSVSFLPVLGCYVMVYTRLGLSQEIMMRQAPTPVGPWSEPIRLYQAPGLPSDTKAFFYAAKAHPSLAAENELVISYVANSFDFGKLVRTPEIYRPWFIRVRFEK